MNGKIRKRAITGFGVVLLFVLAFSLFFALSFKTVVVSGPSMEPTFYHNDRLLSSSAYWLVGALKKSDVVVIKVNDPARPYIIKRIAGLGGDKINLVNVPKDWSLSKGDYLVPQGQVYVLGDNREVSEDSRSFGPVPIGDIIGKIVMAK